MLSIKLKLIFVGVCVCVALVVPAAKLEQPGCYSPGVHGFPHLRRGQSSTAEVHSQAWQVRRKQSMLPLGRMAHMCITHLLSIYPNEHRLN